MVRVGLRGDVRQKRLSDFSGSTIVYIRGMSVYWLCNLGT